VVIANNLGDKKKGEQQEGGIIENDPTMAEQRLEEGPPLRAEDLPGNSPFQIGESPL
jgi:hypothetical protein